MLWPWTGRMSGNGAQTSESESRLFSKLRWSRQWIVIATTKLNIELRCSELVVAAWRKEKHISTVFIVLQPDSYVIRSSLRWLLDCLNNILNNPVATRLIETRSDSSEGLYHVGVQRWPESWANKWRWGTFRQQKGLEARGRFIQVIVGSPLKTWEGLHRWNRTF